jgi:RimJ/RimL family protein N-acetyltransferase
MSDSIDLSAADWRRELPTLTSRGVTLREATPSDLGPLFDLLSLSDATRFGVDDPVTEVGVLEFIEQAIRQRSAGLAFAYAISPGTSRSIVGLVYVKQLDLAFDSAEWEVTLAPSARGTAVFIETARLAGSFTFGTIGCRRLEARVPVQNGRANGALRKLGAVQEGVLRRSARRSGEYLDQVLWSILKEDWGEHWVSTAARVH